MINFKKVVSAITVAILSGSVTYGCDTVGKGVSIGNTYNATYSDRETTTVMKLSNAKVNKLGDVNSDDVVDARDASLILAYYAATSTGFEGTMEEYVANGLSNDTEVTTTETATNSNTSNSTTAVETNVIETTETISQTTIEDTPEEPITTAISSITSVKTFNRGTYYCYDKECYGGSGRKLIDCSIGDGEIKGSVACSYLYYMYGYNYGSSGRTTVYLDVKSKFGSDLSALSGYYYVDDSDAGNPEVIDFYYDYTNNCPVVFRNEGVVTVDCYILN